MAQGQKPLIREQAWEGFDLKIKNNWPEGSHRMTTEYSTSNMRMDVYCGNCHEVHNMLYRTIIYEGYGPKCLQQLKQTKTSRANFNKKLAARIEKGVKVCFECKQEKSFEAFGMNNRSKDKRTSYLQGLL